MTSLVDQLFDKIYYINLDRDNDRNDHILNEFVKYNITNYKRISGVIVDELPDISLYRNFIHRGDKYITGQLGCRRAHLNLINDAKINGYKNILIFEDDIQFNIDPNVLLNGNYFNIQTFDLLYFGGLQEQVFNNQIVEAHAMGINHRIFDDILYMAEASGMEIDNFYAKILQQMSKNTRIGGRCVVKKVEPFNSIIQLKTFSSNIVGND